MGLTEAIFAVLLLDTANTLESSFPLTVLPLKFNENFATQDRFYYTEASVLSYFRHSNYSSVNTTAAQFGLATPDIDCEVVDTLCPQLVQVFHVNVNGSPRLAVWNDVKLNDSLEILDEAGYVGSWPGYCGTSNGVLVEMYSPILKTFRYVTSNEEVQKARWNEDKMFWRPTNILGYLFNATVPDRVVSYPFNAMRPLDSVIFNKLSVAMHPLIRVRNSQNKTAFTTSFRNNDYLADYKFDKVLNISLVDQLTNVTVIEDVCGKMHLLYEVSNTGAYRLKFLRDVGDNEEVVKRSGYVFREEWSARRCLGEILPIYEYQNPNNHAQVHYVSSEAEAAEFAKGWTKLGQLGFSSWGNFAFASR